MNYYLQLSMYILAALLLYFTIFIMMEQQFEPNYDIINLWFLIYDVLLIHFIIFDPFIYYYYLMSLKQLQIIIHVQYLFSFFKFKEIQNQKHLLNFLETFYFIKSIQGLLCLLYLFFFKLLILTRLFLQQEYQSMKTQLSKIYYSRHLLSFNVQTLKAEKFHLLLYFLVSYYLKLNPIFIIKHQVEQPLY